MYHGDDLLDQGEMAKPLHLATGLVWMEHGLMTIVNWTRGGDQPFLKHGWAKHKGAFVFRPPWFLFRVRMLSRSTCSTP